jgi:hypothetical protein
MDKKIKVALLMIVFDRLEYFYEVVNPDTNICLLAVERCFRADSFVYFACVKVQQWIFVYVIHLLVPLKEYSKWSVWAFALAFVEFFFTYNEPIARIPFPFDMYLPISTAILKFAAVAYFMWGCIKKVWE